METPRWKRYLRSVGRAWIEGSAACDPMLYSHYLAARTAAPADTRAENAESLRAAGTTRILNLAT